MKTQDNKGKSFYRIFCRKLSKPDEESRAKNRGGKERYSELGVFFLSRFFHFFFLFLFYFVTPIHSFPAAFIYKTKRSLFTNKFLEEYVDSDHTFSVTTNQGLIKYNESKKK
jgi:hypothetical protein